MKRSTFLKNLGLSAAAAFCNIKVFAVPKFWLPPPERPEAKLPLALAREDLLQHILDGALEFARDGIMVGEVKRWNGTKQHMALESSEIKLGSEMCVEDIGRFIRAIQYVLEESVRSEASFPVDVDRSVYDDPFPAKYEGGTRVSPFLPGEGPLTLKHNERYDAVSETHFIPKPLLPIFIMHMEIKARVSFDREQNAVGWYVRAVFVRGEISGRT